MSLDCLQIKTRKERRGYHLVALFILVLSSFCSTAEATPGQHGAGLGIGQTVLMGDFASSFSDALGFNLNYTYDASNLFGLLVQLYMSNHSNADESNSLGIKGVTPNLKVNLAYIDKLTLHAFTGFGLFSVSEKIGKQDGSVFTIGFDLGTGFNLTLDDHFVFGTNIAFNNILSKTDSATAVDGKPPLSIGGTYLTLMLNVGYLF